MIKAPRGRARATWPWSRAGRARARARSTRRSAATTARPSKRAVRGRGARDARTHFTVLEALPADTLVEARLETGRTHQIRAHFAAIGHPVAGDPRYGHAGRHGLERQFLHSAGSASTIRSPASGSSSRSELPERPGGGLERARQA